MNIIFSLKTTKSSLKQKWMLLLKKLIIWKI